MKKRLLLALAALLLSCALFGCELLGGLSPGGSGGTTHPGETTTVTGNTDGTTLTTPADDATVTTPSEGETDSPAPHTHTPSEWRATEDAASHVKTCTACGEVLAAEEHQRVSTGLILPTFYTPGSSSGEECTVCHKTFPAGTDFPALERTASDYAYRALADRPNGTALQDFYRDLLPLVVAFHEAEDTNAEATENGYLALSAPISEYGITGEEAFSVLHALKSDYPLFYWIGNRVGSDGKSLNVYTDGEYATAVARRSHNQSIAAGLLALALPSTGESAYTSVWRLHDALIDTLTYAYQSDGVTPEDAAWAHNILGYFEHGSGVCETYTETAALFLNYWGIDNIIATGTADGVNHAWNLVSLGDAEWYWLDITWDDQPSLPTGRQYTYFCKTDAEFLTVPRSLSTEVYSYPDRSTAPYQSSVPAPGSAFRDGRYTYTVSGYGTVELTEVGGIGAVTLPDRITYEGMTYAVTSLGNIKDGTMHPVFASGITEVTLPASIGSVAGNAFGTATIRAIRVDAASLYLTTDGTSLYQKTSMTLLAYLPSATAEELTLPEGTTAIASGAILHNASLKTLILPATLLRVESLAVYNCTALTSIRFAGTAEDWAKVTCASNALPLEVTLAS